MADDGAITRNVLAEQVREFLLAGIFSGRYPPDTRIVETRVAREVGTSQAPVREALRGLEAMGIVEILPFRGARVRRLSVEELVEAYEVRASLETLGARIGVPGMTDQDLAEIEALHDLVQAAGEAGDRPGLAAHDAALHARILALAGNPTLERVWRSLEPSGRTYITLVSPNADTRWSAGLHPPILEALRRRDAQGVEAALRRHFELASDHLASGLREGSPPR
ncbi:MAG TPA: GntR family transcriptional regulator [Candidatus Limnocylindrales bacterium]|nr:GntR family transcriptional regulator [Candidatus Limnocylindrales bacterium]